MIKAYTDTRNFEWEAYANDERGALLAMRQAWRAHKKSYKDCYWVQFMPESEFLEDMSFLEIPNSTIAKRVAYCDREIIWTEK